jgi:hypothetical protein
MPFREGDFARSGAITYEKQDELLMMELRNGVHKYELNLQAGGSITGKMPESTDISCYFR